MSLPKFDEAGNMITTRPPKIEELEDELEEIINGSYTCQYCGKKWAKQLSNTQHERWCAENPNKRNYRNNANSKPKKKKAKAGRPKKVESIIEVLKKADKTFSLTDEQIANYVRGFMK